MIEEVLLFLANAPCALKSLPRFALFSIFNLLNWEEEGKEEDEKNVNSSTKKKQFETIEGMIIKKEGL